jgi:hypothetical protein
MSDFDDASYIMLLLCLSALNLYASQIMPYALMHSKSTGLRVL